MKVSKHEGSIERMVIIGMITDGEVLGRIAPHYSEPMFKSEPANLIAEWCCKHYEKYGEPPGRLIEDMFNRWAKRKSRSKGQIETVESFLVSISDEFSRSSEESNSDYILERATDLFNEVRLRNLSESIGDSIDAGRTDKAGEDVCSFQRISLTASSGIHVLSDSAAIRSVFQRGDESLITYPGALGEFFGNSLQRDGFVSFQAPEKRGKTHWMIDVGWRAVQQRRKTVFFQVGDLSEKQMMQRFIVKVARRPLWINKYNRVVQVPTKLFRNKKGDVQVKHKSIEFEESMTPEDAEKEMSKFLNKGAGGFDDLLRLKVYPNDTITAAGLRAELKRWEREGWVPDVVIIDYADLLAAPEGFRESRDQINSTWKRLRSISQEFHCLVLTATQADAASYGAKLITRRNFSDDKRKYAHVTGMIGINQTDDEKKQGIMRLNWVQLRERAFLESKAVYCAGCLDIGSVARRSCW